MVLIQSALALVVFTGQSEAHGEVTSQPVAALVEAPLEAASPDGTLQVVLVGAVANAPTARSTRALISKQGELVRWVELPLADLPEAVVVPDADTIHCVTDDGDVLTFDTHGASVATARLDGLLPPLASRDLATPITVAYDEHGPCLAVPLACGRLALVGFHGSDEQQYQLCSFIRPSRLACGAEVWLDQARALARDGDVDAALYAYEAAIASSPEDPRGYRELASFHRRQGDDEARLASLRLAMDRLFLEADGPVTNEWRVGTKEARLAMDYVDATRDSRGDGEGHVALDETLDLYPCMAQAVFLRAEMLFEQGDDFGALAALEAALSGLDASCLAPAYHDVGRFLRRKERPVEAIRYFEDAFALGERSEYLFRSLAVLCEERGRYDRAAEWLGELRAQWRCVDNGDSEPERDRLWARRLEELDAEITRMAGLAIRAAGAAR